ncbi:unnamed protein product, partial [Hapterophycus canaliculatus]
LRQVHRNIRSANILLASTEGDEASSLKITGFGMAVSVQDRLVTSNGGTREFSAPEVVSGKPHATTPDVWSIGLISYILLSGKHPFLEEAGKSFHRMAAGDCQFKREDWGNISEEAKDFIQRLLIADMDQRMTAAQAKNHPWLHASEQDLEARDLGKNLQSFKVSNAKRKLRAATRMV